MSREEYDPLDERAARSSRRTNQPTDRLSSGGRDYGEPINRNWRADRAAARGRTTQTLPTSRQEFMLWLQYGGWRIVAIAAAVAVFAIFVLIFWNGSRRPLPQRPQPTAAAAFNLPPVDQPTPTTRPITPTAALPIPGTTGGAQFRVFNTEGLGLFLRPEPNTNNQPIKTLPDGTIVTIIGEDFVGPDRVWKHVRDPEGSEGWVASDFLEPVQ
jgi:hypothetical protein